MIYDLNAIFREAGSKSMDMFWFPLLIWSLCALIVYLLLKVFKSRDVLYQYHTRIALVAGVPVGILASLSAPLLYRLFSGSGSTEPFAFIVIQNPIGVPIESGASLTGNWSDPNVWVGFLTLYLALTGFLLGLQLFWNYMRVSSLAGKFDLLGLQELKQFDCRQIDANDKFISRVSVAFSCEVNVPFTFGWKKPVIIVPDRLRNDPEKTGLVIRHELMHIRYADYLLNAFVLFVKSLFWFHPLIHLFDREIREYREIFCDTQVLADRNVSRKKYAQLLFELAPASISESSPTLSMAVSRSTLLKRIQSIRLLGSSRSFSGSLFASVTLLTTLSIFIACSDLQTTVVTGLNVEQASMGNLLTPSEEVGVLRKSGDESTVPSADRFREAPSANQSGDLSQERTLQRRPTTTPLFIVVEEMPSLIGGLSTLQQRISYPRTALRAGIEGTVIVQFVVNEQGNVENPRVIESVGAGMDEEVLRVISEAKFEPGRQRGEPVRVQYKIPFVFKLMDDESESNISSRFNPEGSPAGDRAKSV